MFHQFSSLAAFGLTIVFVLGVVTSSGPPGCKRIAAAYYYEDNMNFIIDQEVIQIRDDGRENKFPVKDFGYAHPITAAFDSYDSAFFLVSGHDQAGFRRIGVPTSWRLFDFSELEKKFEGQPGYNGIEAVVMGGDDLLYYFAGCYYVDVNLATSEISDKMLNSDVDLPCDVDASVYSPRWGAPVVIKGDQVWGYHPGTYKFYSGIPMDFLIPRADELNLCPYQKE